MLFLGFVSYLESPFLPLRYKKKIPLITRSRIRHGRLFLLGARSLLGSQWEYGPCTKVNVRPPSQGLLPTHL